MERKKQMYNANSIYPPSGILRAKSTLSGTISNAEATRKFRDCLDSLVLLPTELLSDSSFEFINTSYEPLIENVIFNPPATVVFWSDGTKTVVKCSEKDTFDKEKGLAMAITKHFFGNKGRYNDELRKWIKE